MQRRMVAIGAKRTLFGFGRGSILMGVAAPGDRSNRRNGLGVETLDLLNIEMIYIGIRTKVDIGERPVKPRPLFGCSRHDRASLIIGDNS